MTGIKQNFVSLCGLQSVGLVRRRADSRPQLQGAQIHRLVLDSAVTNLTDLTHSPARSPGHGMAVTAAARADCSPCFSTS
eukprot:756506-Hanusia_phi.AAC.4